MGTSGEAEIEHVLARIAEHGSAMEALDALGLRPCLSERAVEALNRAISAPRDPAGCLSEALAIGLLIGRTTDVTELAVARMAEAYSAGLMIGAVKVLMTDVSDITGTGEAPDGVVNGSAGHL